MGRRIIETQVQDEDIRIEQGLRPTTFQDYIGQEKIKGMLKIYIEAAKQRKEPLDHVLLYGPPGLGKTTLAGIIANEMQVNMKVTSGPAIGKPGEMASILSNLQENDILFVDEIHRLNRQVEEDLYPANRLLKRVRDFAQIKYDGVITKDIASLALDLLEVDKLGLDKNDRMILRTIMEKFSGGPIGLDTLAAAIGEDAGTIEDVYEPYLVQNGLINRTPRGRMATEFAYHHFGIPYPDEE